MNTLFQKINQKKGDVIAFLNQKGGVGKTTMAYNTAFALAHKGFKVLCLDLDPQANFGLLFDADTLKNSEYNIYHLLLNSVRELKSLHSPVVLSECVVNIKTSQGQLDFIPSGIELSGLELTLAGIRSPRQLVLRRFIEKNNLDQQYDYIIVDSPPTLGLLVVNVLCACSGIIVPFRPDNFSKMGLYHLQQILEDIDDMGVVDVPKILAYVPNLLDGRRKQEGIDLNNIHELVLEFDANAVIGPSFFNRAQFVKSQSQKKSVFNFSSKDYLPLQNQFNELANIIISNRDKL